MKKSHGFFGTNCHGFDLSYPVTGLFRVLFLAGDVVHFSYVLFLDIQLSFWLDCVHART
jgi:hypothetical protein